MLCLTGNLLIGRRGNGFLIHTADTRRQTIAKGIGDATEIGIDAVNLATAFIINQHIFLGEGKFFPQLVDQLRSTGEEQTEGQFKAGYVIDIKQRNTQSFFNTGILLLALRQNLFPLAGNARRLVDFSEMIFFNQVIDTPGHFFPSHPPVR